MQKTKCHLNKEIRIIITILTSLINRNTTRFRLDRSSKFSVMMMTLAPNSHVNDKMYMERN